jgi:hypothetical protein
MALWFDSESPMAPVNPALLRDLPEAPLASPVLTPPAVQAQTP